MPLKFRKPKIMPGQLPLFAPESHWEAEPPERWPDFRSHVKVIGVDCESSDPLLQTKGPGYIRGDAKVCGVALASPDGTKLYLPIAHPEECVDPDQARAYLRHQLGGDQVKCGANLTYDMEALWSEGIELKGPLGDIQIAEPLLDEDRPGGYSLDVLAKAYLGEGKNEGLLADAASAYSVDKKKGMAWIPGRYVGPYAEDDAYKPTKIYEEQLKRLAAEDLLPIFQLEQKLQRVLFKMRLRGVRIDIDRAVDLSRTIQLDEAKLLDKLREEVRIDNPSSSADVGRALRSIGLDVPSTAKGNDSIANEWLKEQNHPVAQLLHKWRTTTKMRRDFIDTLVEDNVNGRIYSNWHQLRDFDDDAGKARGTRSGRIAASKFNLTQVPSRDEYWGPLIRKLFIADEGMHWVKGDISQQEPRILLHFAYLMEFPGAAEARQRYLDDPSTDYHQLVADLILERTGQTLARRPAKDINLGSAYGMGKNKMASKLGVTRAKAEELLTAYHEGVPYVKKIERAASDRAQDKGFITTILGRKRRFDSWEPARYGEGNNAFPIRGLANARNVWPDEPLRRAMTHKALNGLVQGSAADQMKKTLVDLDEAGALPQIQVYDEINGSYDYDESKVRLLKEIMENSVPMTVPFLVSPETGPSWGDTKEWKNG